MENESLEDFLNKEFENKKNLNPRFSLRAFAKQLDLEPSQLSKILRKKYKLTPKLISEISQKLDIDQKDKDAFIKINNKIVELQKFSELEVQELSEFANWFDFVILRYFDLNEKMDLNVLSKKLNVSLNEIKDTIQKLEKNHLIEKNKEGKYTRTNKQFLIRPDANNEVLNKKILKQHVTKALESIDKNPVKSRTHMVQVMSINKKNYAKIQQKIHALAMEINRLANEDTGHEDCVMLMNVNFFPVII